MARILIGNVKGPIGATGPVGPRGPEGPQGIQGPLCPLTNNALATVPGVAALDAVMGKTLSDKDTALQNEVTKLNSDLKNRFEGIRLWDASVGNNDYLQIIKNKWRTLPDGIYFVRIDSTNAAIAIIYKEGIEHGSVYIMGYSVSSPVYSRIIGGTWV